VCDQVFKLKSKNSIIYVKRFRLGIDCFIAIPLGIRLALLIEKFVLLGPDQTYSEDHWRFHNSKKQVSSGISRNCTCCNKGFRIQETNTGSEEAGWYFVFLDTNTFVTKMYIYF
jgi:hypothetical protein